MEDFYSERKNKTTKILTNRGGSSYIWGPPIPKTDKTNVYIGFVIFVTDREFVHKFMNDLLVKGTVKISCYTETRRLDSDCRRS